MIAAMMEMMDVIDNEAMSLCIESGSIIIDDVPIKISVTETLSLTATIDGIASLIMRRYANIDPYALYTGRDETNKHSAKQNAL